MQSLMCLEREFHRKGAAMEKAQSPHVRCLVLCGTERRQRSGGGGRECGGGAGQ